MTGQLGLNERVCVVGGAVNELYTTFVFPAPITKVNLGVFVLKTFHQVILELLWLLRTAIQLKCKNKGEHCATLLSTPVLLPFLTDSGWVVRYRVAGFPAGRVTLIG